jgi:DnaJ-domain-containing protein 1
MYDSDSKLEKVKLAVEMEIDSGLRLLGSVFVGQRQRLPDLLNDDRAFLPFETSEGIIKIIRKSTIRSVTPLNQVTLPMTTTDPYEILGVASSIGDEELKSIYHRKVQETHPDKLVSMGLPLEFVQLANEKVARINDAYDRIRQQRQSRTATAPKWYPGG